MHPLLLVHALATWFMVGVIWLIQLVHYPLFSYTDGEWYRPFAADHARRISWIAIPGMLIELGTGLALACGLGTHPSLPQAWLGLSLIVLIWLSTFFLQVPQHRLLSEGYHPRAHQRLVATNWVRTILWSVRGLLVAGWLI